MGVDKQNIKPVSTILVSQNKPTQANSAYFRLAEQYNIKIDFRSFIEIVAVEPRQFRSQKIDILSHTAVIFTSRHAVDHFFNLSEQLRIEIPSDMKYFCISDLVANYVQKYIVLRKRKMFSGGRTVQELMKLIGKHPDENFLIPTSSTSKNELPLLLEASGYQYSTAIFYQTISSDLSDLADVNYDVIAFFSPADIDSLFENFPNFQQNETRIAGFGDSTAKAIVDRGLRLDIEAPLPQAPSMTGALELYIKLSNNS